MKAIKLYQCNICGTQYADLMDCMECEKCHKTEIEIIDMQHVPFKNNQKGYPIRIKVRCKGVPGFMWYRLQ